MEEKWALPDARNPAETRDCWGTHHRLVPASSKADTEPARKSNRLRKVENVSPRSNAAILNIRRISALALEGARALGIFLPKYGNLSGLESLRRDRQLKSTVGI